MTLTELNTAKASDRIEARDGVPTGWTFHKSYAVGRCGSARRRGTAGGKLHLLRVEVVTGKPADTDRKTIKVGENYMITGCNGNGQRTGVVVKELDTDAITCTKCHKRLAAIVASIGAEKAAL